MSHPELIVKDIIVFGVLTELKGLPQSLKRLPLNAGS